VSVYKHLYTQNISYETLILFQKIVGIVERKHSNVSSKINYKILERSSLFS